MNPLSAGLLLLFAVGITLAPWRRPETSAPGRALVIEGALLLGVVLLSGERCAVQRAKDRFSIHRSS